MARGDGVGFGKKQLLVFHDGWALENNASDEEIKGALLNAAFFQPQLPTVAYRLGAFDAQMAGARRPMCAGFLIRSFFAFFVQMPRVVTPALDFDAGYLMGSIGWDSDSDRESGSEGAFQVENPNKKAKKETAAEESGQQQVQRLNQLCQSVGDARSARALNSNK